MDPAGGGLTSISCASSTTCVAVDSDGRALTDELGVWSAPVAIDAGHPLIGVSCPSETFCAAVTSDGDVITRK